MFKIFASIGLILVGNVFAAQTTEDNSAQNLETIEGRIVSATAFEMMAIKASVDDADREELNTSLIDQFTNAGAFSFFELKTIEIEPKDYDERFKEPKPIEFNGREITIDGYSALLQLITLGVIKVNWPKEADEADEADVEGEADTVIKKLNKTVNKK